MNRAVLFLVLVVVAAVALFGGLLLYPTLTNGGGADDVTAAGEGPPPFTVPAGDPTEISSDRIMVTASSFLSPDGDITYDPANLLDNDLETAWNSDAPENEGQGQIITFRFPEPVDLQAVRFVNGYAKNEGVYAANHRVQELLVTTDGSDQTQPVTLLDTSDRQEISVDFGLTTKVQLEIVEVYPGDGFTDSPLTADLALTEVTFLAVQP